MCYEATTKLVFIEKRKKLKLEAKTREKRERIVAALGLENCFMRLPQV